MSGTDNSLNYIVTGTDISFISITGYTSDLSGQVIIPPTILHGSITYPVQDISQNAFFR